jgi:hypothetical protein
MRQLLRVCALAAVAALFEREPARVYGIFFEMQLKRAVGPFCRVLARSRKPYRLVEGLNLTGLPARHCTAGSPRSPPPQPVLGFDRAAAPAWVRDGKPLLVLGGVGNPHNLGAIARSAAFFGLERMLFGHGPAQALPADGSHRIAEGGLGIFAVVPGAAARCADRIAAGLPRYRRRPGEPFAAREVGSPASDRTRPRQRGERALCGHDGGLRGGPSRSRAAAGSNRSTWPLRPQLCFMR